MVRSPDPVRRAILVRPYQGIDYDTPIGCVECVVSCACVLCMWCACMCEYVWYGKPELVRVL